VKVFLAWSGPTSQKLASFMHEWLQSVVQAIEPFMSSMDIRQGQRWSSEIGANLKEAQFALLCLTPTNLENRWIHFEAGAVSKSMDTARVSALLFDVKPTQVEFPLQQFQHTPLTREGLWKLVQDMNNLCPAKLGESILRKAFERSFPEVEMALSDIGKTLAQELKGKVTPTRPPEAVLDDLLTTQQGFAAKLDSIEQTIAHLGRTMNVIAHEQRGPRLSPSYQEQVNAGSGELFAYLSSGDSNGDVSESGLARVLESIRERFGRKVEMDVVSVAASMGKLPPSHAAYNKTAPAREAIHVRRK
jgi:hypothetical protein